MIDANNYNKIYYLFNNSCINKNNNYICVMAKKSIINFEGLELDKIKKHCKENNLKETSQSYVTVAVQLANKVLK